MSDLIVSPDNSYWRRRELTVESENSTMRLKLWGEQSCLVDDNFVGQNALIKNIVVDRYKGSNTLASTDQTTVEVSLLKFQYTVWNYVEILYNFCLAFYVQ